MLKIKKVAQVSQFRPHLTFQEMHLDRRLAYTLHSRKEEGKVEKSFYWTCFAGRPIFPG